MILRALTLENFKGIGEPVRIEFEPLTLLFGPNNAGKSTIIQALMYAREVLERNNCDVTRTSLGGDVVDLGGFRNLVHKQDRDRTIRMRFELDLRPHGIPDDMSDFAYPEAFRAALGLDNRFGWALRQMTQVWVEIEIVHRKSSSAPYPFNPVVRRYSVGSGPTVYATISLPGDSERAALTYFNFGVSPFGCGYSKGDQSDFEWQFTRLARMHVQWLLLNNGIPQQGIAAGVRVAFAGEPIRPEDNLISRQEFDALVSSIQNEDGAWWGDTINPDTRATFPPFRSRQEMIDQAHDMCRHCGQEVEDFTINDLGRRRPSDDSLSQGYTEEKPDLLCFPSGDFYEPAATIECAGWLLDWFSGLTREFDYPLLHNLIWFPSGPIELTMRDTALPDWQDGINPYYDIWYEEKEDKDLKRWRRSAEQDLLRFLSAIIVLPGQRLLSVLQGSLYLGPFRKLPSRDYRWVSGSAPASWASGLAAWDHLLQEDSHPLEEAVNDWLSSAKGLNLGYRVTVQRLKKLPLNSELWNALLSGDRPGGDEFIRQELPKLREESNLVFVNTRSGIKVAAQDLGVGISQVIPVIVAALHETQGVVAIEEPESNVHPAFQVVLADLFITRTRANPDVLFLVETHSEHLMLRCLRRIRETSEGKVPEDEPSLKPEEIAVHFVEPGDDGPRIHRIRIDEDGEFLDPWPRGFFRERSKELYGDDL